MNLKKIALFTFFLICLVPMAVLYLKDFYLKKRTPKKCFPEDIMKTNPDYFGTLMIPSLLWEPVVKHTNNSYYLTRNFQGEPDKDGCLFADAEYQEGSHNLVIYGHNSFNQKRFSNLLKYKSKDYARQHSTIYFTDKNGILHTYKVFFVLHYSVDDLSHNNPYLPDLPADYLDRFSSYPTWYRDYGIQDLTDLRLLTLSTCDETIYGSSGRLLVVSKEIASDTEFTDPFDATGLI